MSWARFFLITGSCVFTMLLCRVAPIFLLKGKKLPPHFEAALNFIPPAVFAALVANDLLTSELLTHPTWSELIPIIASGVVVIVALKTKSLLWCIVAGIGAFGLLLLI